MRHTRLHLCESYRWLIPQPLAPNIEGLFCNLLLFAELFHREAAALVRGDPLPPVFFSLFGFLLHAGLLRYSPLWRLPEEFDRAVHEPLTISDMIRPVPRGVEQSTKITEEQVMAWIEADKAKTPAAEREFIKYTSFHVLLGIHAY